jgi:hypothetical protein
MFVIVMHNHHGAQRTYAETGIRHRHAVLYVTRTFLCLNSQLKSGPTSAAAHPMCSVFRLFSQSLVANQLLLGVARVGKSLGP